MANTKAQTEKEKGNASFKTGNYVDAIGHYTAAILADRKDHTFPLNRAAAYLKLGKYEDAERDCTTVLKLSALNAKALYRRGQARLAIGKLEEAADDLTQALKREPANVAIQEESKKAAGLLEQKRRKTSKPLTGAAISPSIPAPKRRRVPIKIIDASEAGPASSPSSSNVHKTARSTSSEASRTPAAASTGDIETIRPVSTRSLKPETSATIPPSLSPSSTSSSTTPPPTPLASKPEQPRTFKDVKQARENSKPSRVGGGIFRASGESTIFPTRSSSSTSLPTPPSISERQTIPTPIAIVPVIPEKPPKTCFDFTKTWDAESLTAVRWGLILSIPPTSIPALFKTSLEPVLLMSILTVFEEVLKASQGDAERVRGYMEAFGKVERFETVVLFLSCAEKALAKSVWEALRVKQEDVMKAWRSVWN